LSEAYQELKTGGRLDKESSGLVILSNDGDLLQKLTHPSISESKVYEVELNKDLSNEHKSQIESGQVKLSDGISKFIIKPRRSDPKQWEITMSEGRNRQIRRTFEQLGYQVNKLHRICVGPYKLGDLAPGKTKLIY
jgi:23S rRNA pseudouridine2605 synthase